VRAALRIAASQAPFHAEIFVRTCKLICTEHELILRSDTAYPARRRAIQSIENQWRQRAQVNQAIGTSLQDNDPDRELCNVLLVFNTAIHRDESVVTPRCPGKQLAIADTCPATPLTVST
jgi:hypothetical protein